MNLTENPTSKITGEYRKKLALTYRAFANALNEYLVNISISHVAIMNWEKNITDPNTDFLLICLVVYDDWRAEWAVKCLCAKLPEVFNLADGHLIVLANKVLAEKM